MANPKTKAVQESELPTAPALAFSISVPLGTSPGDPQLAFQSMFDFEADEATINTGLDKVLNVIRRQKARQEIERLEQENRRNLRMMAGDAQNITRAEADYTTRRRAILDEAGELEQSLPMIEEKARQEWTAAGRVGEFKPNNSTVTALQRTKKASDDLKASLTNLDLERSNALQAVSQKTASWQAEIDQNNAEIDRLRSIAGD